MTMEEGIKIYEAAGYTVRLVAFGYYLYEEDKKVGYYSTNNWLSNFGFIIHDIQNKAFNKGAKAGRNELRRELSMLLKKE